MWKNILSLVTSIIGGIGVQIYIYLAILIAGFGGGFYLEHLRYQAYRLEVEAAGKVAEAHVAAVEQQQALITKEISNDYQTKLTNIRNYYASGLHNTSSGAMSGISASPKGTDAETAYPILARQCAETTLQVNLWQEWAQENGMIK